MIPINEEDYYLSTEAPFFTEQLYKLQEEIPGFGLANCTWKDSLTNLLAHKDNIIDLFNSKYYFYEIGAETEERWMQLLQNRLMVIEEQYDRMFSLYANNDTEEIGRTIKVKSKEKFQDTPVTPLQADNYATNITDNENETTILDKNRISLINDNIKEWKNLENMFVDEFKKLFINMVAIT